MFFCIVILENLKILLDKNSSRITKKDLLIAEELMDECNMDFENVSLRSIR